MTGEAILVAGFSLVAVANRHMSLFGRLRGKIKEDKVETALAESVYRRHPLRVRFLATNLLYLSSHS
jgi:hypothetical protein